MVTQKTKKWYSIFGDFMELYYKNETLFVDVDLMLDEENIGLLKRRIFRIVDDYDIDHIVFHTIQKNANNTRFLKQIESEYHERYNGIMFIK